MSIVSQFIDDLEQTLKESHDSSNAWKVIEEYFAFFKKEQVSKELWELTVGNLINKKLFKMKESVRRENLIFFYEYTVLLISAIDILMKERKIQGALDHRQDKS